MKTLKFIKAFNLWELTITMLLAMLIMTKLLNIVSNNTLKIQQMYLQWRYERLQDVMKINQNLKE